MSGIDGYSDSYAGWQPTYAFEVKAADGTVLLSVDQDGKVYLSQQLDLTQARELGYARLRVLRDLANTAMYDLDRLPRM